LGVRSIEREKGFGIGKGWIGRNGEGKVTRGGGRGGKGIDVSYGVRMTFIKVSYRTSCVFHVILRFPCTFFLGKSFPSDKELLFPSLKAYLLDFFYLVFFFSVYYLQWWSGSRFFLFGELRFIRGFKF
jgi:hypothetical protein